MKELGISLGLWKWEGLVFCGGDSAQFRAVVKRYIDADIETQAHSCAHAYLEYGKPWMLWIQTLDDVPSLAHEALHITAGLLEARGLKFTEASEEAYTYTMEAIIRAVLTAKKAEWKTIKP